MSTDPALPPLPPGLLAEVQRDLGALARSRRRRAAIFAALALALVVGFGFMAGHDATHGFTAPGCGSGTHLAIVIGFGVVGLLLVGLAFGLALPAGRKLRSVPAVGLAGGLAGLGAIAVLYGQSGTLSLHGAGCLSTGAIVSLALVIVLLGLGRKVLRRHAPSAGLFGVGIGLLALIPLSLACHDASMPHLLVWHGMIPVASGLVSSIAWRITRPEPE